MLCVTEGAIRAAMLEGRLAFSYVLGRKVMTRADVEAYRARTQPDGTKPRGRPRKAAG